MLEMAAALKAAIPRSLGAALPSPRALRRAPATPSSGVVAASDGSELPTSSGGVAHGGQGSAPSDPRLASADVAAQSPSRREVAPMQSAPAPAPESPPGRASADARSWLLSAEPPAPAVPVARRAHEREHHITIGRIDVEVHNEAPAAPPVPAVGRDEPSRRAARVASRFLLKS